jgi:beta-lactam-binding protein with PASTA domain
VPPKCVVPNVVGQLLTRARTRIRSAHCRVGTVTYAVSTRKKKNRVLSQTPAPRKRLKNGARVNVRVGRGPRR